MNLEAADKRNRRASASAEEAKNRWIGAPQPLTRRDSGDAFARAILRSGFWQARAPQWFLRGFFPPLRAIADGDQVIVIAQRRHKLRLSRRCRGHGTEPCAFQLAHVGLDANQILLLELFSASERDVERIARRIDGVGSEPVLKPALGHAQRGGSFSDRQQLHDHRANFDESGSHATTSFGPTAAVYIENARNPLDRGRAEAPRKGRIFN